MEGFILLAIILLGMIALLELSSASAKKPEKCGVHDWSYNKDNKLQCTRCNMLAGSIKTDSGDYS